MSNTIAKLKMRYYSEYGNTTDIRRMARDGLSYIEALEAEITRLKAEIESIHQDLAGEDI